MSRTAWLVIGWASVVLAGVAHTDATPGSAPVTPPRGMPSPQAHAQRASAVSPPPSESPRRAFLTTYCVTCHNQRLHTAGLVLDNLDVDSVAAGAEVWERVIRKLRAGAMPPTGARKPDAAAYHSFMTSLEDGLDAAAAKSPRIGRSVVNRLNRAEYANVIRDLLAVQIDSESLLPPDDEDQGFENIADVLSVSPTLIERYLYAARRISQLAIGDPSFRGAAETYTIPEGEFQEDQTSDMLPFGSRGGVAIRHNFALDGEYLVRVRLRRNFYNYVRGMGNEPHRLDVRVDGALVKTFTVGGSFQGPKCPASYCGTRQGEAKEWEFYLTHADDGLDVRLPMKAGMRTVGVAFLKLPGVDEGILQPPTNLATFGYATDEMPDGNPAVATVNISGPFDASGPGETASRRRIFVCRPKGRGADDEQRCARTILGTLARRAFRRPETDADVRALLNFYEPARRDGGFDAGIQAALERLLVDPEFIFRLERGAAGAAAGRAQRLSDTALASRLSFFLWSSIPDEELLRLAAQGKLRDARVLERQVRRMLEDPRSEALAANFLGQWLQMGRFRNVAPDPTVFPDFDQNLRDAMATETSLFLRSQLAEDRGLLDLLRADYTFVDERLARHYGIPNIYGNHFRRVSVDANGPRAGLLGQGSLLTLTSYSNRTSPVGRGKWVLETLIGSPPPPPPPNVPSLPDRDHGRPASSMRERMEQHRANPVCAVCHRMMDPLGFALENFDGIGRWRAADESGVPGERGVPIDSSGVYLDGSQFEGASGLRQLLLKREDAFVTTVTEKLLTYALGRRVEYYEMPAVRQIVGKAAPADYRWSSVILSVVQSDPFQMREGAEP